MKNVAVNALPVPAVLSCVLHQMYASIQLCGAMAPKIVPMTNDIVTILSQ